MRQRLSTRQLSAIMGHYPQPTKTPSNDESARLNMTVLNRLSIFSFYVANVRDLLPRP